MNGFTDWDWANLFLNVIGMILFFGTVWGLVARGFHFIMPKGREKY